MSSTTPHPPTGRQLLRPLGLPIERKVPLLISALLLLVMGVATAAAYFEVRQAAQVAASARLVTVGGELAELMQASVSQRAALMRHVAGDPAVHALVRRPLAASDTSMPAVLHALAQPPDTVLVVSVWDAARRERATAGRAPTADLRIASDLLSTPLRADSVRFSHLFTHGDSIFYWMAVPVSSNDRVLGYLLQRRRILAMPGTEQRVRGLIGERISLLFANASGDVRTTLGGVLSNDDDSSTSTSTGRRLVTTASVPGTPWVWILQLPRSAIMERPFAFLRQMAIISAALVLVGALLGWIVSRRIMRPLSALAAATAAVARGEHPKRVEVRTRDELERLAEAFNIMTERVAESLAALRATNAELERQRATSEDARRTAVAASQAKSNFLAVMSHELRTPLNAILGFSSLLLDGLAGPLNDQQREQVRRIRGGGRHLLALIEEILALTRIESGREEIRLTDEDALTLARDGAALAEPMARAAGLELIVHIPSGRCPVRTDVTKVRQILLNLLSNAVKFTPAGQVELRVACESEYVTFEVQDTGIGIEPALLPQIFEPFYQVDQSKTRRVPGMGLGLTVARRMARLLGGDIEVVTTPGHGSTFTFTLPLRAPDRDERSGRISGEHGVAAGSIPAHLSR